jgi:hypothetical protein
MDNVQKLNNCRNALLLECCLVSVVRSEGTVRYFGVVVDRFDIQNPYELLKQ